MSLICQKCGTEMPPLDDDLAKLARRAGGIVLAHEVCPNEKSAAPEGRYFEVRVSIVEVLEEVPATADPDDSDVQPEVRVEEMVSFKAGVRSANLDDAMRPLATALGEKWMQAEKNAMVADDAALQGR